MNMCICHLASRVKIINSTEAVSFPNSSCSYAPRCSHYTKLVFIVPAPHFFVLLLHMYLPIKNVVVFIF